MSATTAAAPTHCPWWPIKAAYIDDIEAAGGYVLRRLTLDANDTLATQHFAPAPVILAIAARDGVCRAIEASGGLPIAVDSPQSLAWYQAFKQLVVTHCGRRR
jgi:hypothetical protein